MVPSNQINVIFIILLPFNGTFVIFFLFHIEIEGKCGWIVEGAKAILPPPSQIIGGLGPHAPPSPYAYGLKTKYVEFKKYILHIHIKLTVYYTVSFTCNNTVSFTCNIYFLNSTYFIFIQFKSSQFSRFFCCWVYFNAFSFNCQYRKN